MRLSGRAVTSQMPHSPIREHLVLIEEKKLKAFCEWQQCRASDPYDHCAEREAHRDMEDYGNHCSRSDSLNSWHLCLGLVFSIIVIKTFLVHVSQQSGPEEAEGCKIRRKIAYGVVSSVLAVAPLYNAHKLGFSLW